MSDVQPFELGSYTEFDRKYWSALNITVGELMDAEVVTKDWFMTFDYYDEAQGERLWTKFIGRYQFQEIGIIPPGKWKLRLIAKLNEIMPKYKFLYKALEDGATPMTDYDEWHKQRDIFSSFPQTALGGSNQDYASSGQDKEYETIRDYGLLDVSERIADYNDVDVMILDELATLFMVIRSTSLAWM